MAEGAIQAFPAELSSTQKLLWVLPLALEWEQDIPADPQHGELCSPTRTRRGWDRVGGNERT